jgi:hypothetical protein
MPATIEAFVSDLGISLEPAEPGAWNPYHLRRGDAIIPCEAWTRLDGPPAEADVRTAIAWMAAVHSTGSPARAERMRAVYLLGQEEYDHLVSVIGPAIAPPVPAERAPGSTTPETSRPPASSAGGLPSSSRDDAALGEADGLIAAQAVAAVFVSAYRPALYGALTLTAVALSNIPASGFYACLGEEAYGSDWPWRGGTAHKHESTYDKAFEPAVKAAIRTEATVGEAVRELAVALQSPATGSPDSVGILRWVAAFDRRGQRAWEEEVRLSAERDATLARRRPGAWILPAPRRHGFLERGSVTNAYPSRVEHGSGGYVAVVTRSEIGREIFRAAYATSAEAAAAAEAVASVCWQIGRLPHLARLDQSLRTGAFVGEPYGRDVMERLLRLADRVDRSERGYGLGEFTDCETWDRIERGDVAGLLARFQTPPFGLRVN